MSASARTYTVTYQEGLHVQQIYLAVEAFVNPPPNLGNGNQTYVRFRGQRTLYNVYDTTSATIIVGLAQDRQQLPPAHRDHCLLGALARQRYRAMMHMPQG